MRGFNLDFKTFNGMIYKLIVHLRLLSLFIAAVLSVVEFRVNEIRLCG